MIYGYTRVSSKSQIDNNSFVQQEEEIKVKYNNARIYKEQFTGATTHRPIFEEVLTLLNSGDTLVVTKLDRLARTTCEGIEVVQDLFKRNISVHVLNVGLLEDTPMGQFFLTTLLAVAELERNQIVERTQSGKAIARTKEGFKEGRPKKYTQEQITLALGLLKDNSYKQVERMTGISKSTLIRASNKSKSIQD